MSEEQTTQEPEKKITTIRELEQSLEENPPVVPPFTDRQTILDNMEHVKKVMGKMLADMRTLKDNKQSLNIKSLQSMNIVSDPTTLLYDWWAPIIVPYADSVSRIFGLAEATKAIVSTNLDILKERIRLELAFIRTSIIERTKLGATKDIIEDLCLTYQYKLGTLQLQTENTKLMGQVLEQLCFAKGLTKSYEDANNAIANAIGILKQAPQDGSDMIRKKHGQ